MNRIDRLFGILTFLQSKKYVPAEAIAAKFGMSVRTVYRDIKALNEQGIPVSFEAGKGYFVVQGYFLPPVAFTSEEAGALLLMETMVEGFADQSIRKHYTSALHKVKSVLRGRQKDHLETLSQTMRFQLPACIQNSFEYLTVLQTAISEKQVIEIEYQNKQAEVSRRKLEPIGLIFYAFSWHLIAWCHFRQEYRDFKVSRILRVHTTSAPFTRMDHIALAEYMKELPVAY
ncbi:MAG: DNA-binding transcriptional regulator [Flaviaesturariibacter sp.]|nr:DNA-binding transcriptional regulator [Flaviaesturariibacter sp.]